MAKASIKTTRAVQIADSLWQTFEQMSEGMSTDRDGLINQAMFMFARLNGFLDVAAITADHDAHLDAPTPPPSADAPTDQGQPTPEASGHNNRSNDEISTSRKYIGVSMDEPTPKGQMPSSGRLYLSTDDGKQDGVDKDRFLIGRGRHCDFVINSGKVSREHAVILREGGDYFIEDLGSSNGTWYNKQRISRRKIQDGDEYFICNEKIKLLMH